MSALAELIERVKAASVDVVPSPADVLGELIARVKGAADAEVKVEGFKAGGKGDLSFPRDHVAGMRVPKGGSCCKNCKYVDAEGHACKNAHYYSWNGGDGKLPDRGLDEICSDWYEPAEKLA